jgi:alpha-L-rhamnosidase
VIIPALGHVKASHDSPKGPLAAEWAIAGDRVTYTVTLPPGCEGRFDGTRRAGATVDGRAATGVTVLPSGRHVIEFATE